jgi:Ca-activated chloride channel family protein
MTYPGLQTTAGTPIPLQGVAIAREIYGGYALLRVTQRYQNTEPQPVEAVYTFPLPADATLIGFSMECNGRRLAGIVKEREDAFRQYDDALVEGHGATLLEQERPNVFTISVGNLLPGEETLIEVQYAQRVHADEGVLRCMIPTLVAPRYIPGTPTGDRTGDGWAEPTNQVPDADRITPRIGIVTYGLTFDILFDFGMLLRWRVPHMPCG